MSERLYCGLVSKDHIGEDVRAYGWIQRRRDMGGLIFLDIRDREGVVQAVFDKEDAEEAWETADSVRSEYVVEVKGQVRQRSEDTINPNIPNGDVEIEASALKILNKAQTPPFQIEDDQHIKDELRGKYRYLDLRRPKMQQNIKLRHDVVKATRDFLTDEGYLEIETPILGKSTPEGARDYLVPSRLHPGEFYALPQSPQTFKQILMASGFDKYYQIARSFRDEDLRGDRQPEFTQIDIETSFKSAEEIQTDVEGLIQHIMKEVKGVDIDLPIRRMTYETAINDYGSDKPDLRFDMKLIDVSDAVYGSDFNVFNGAIDRGGIVKALNVKGHADSFSRADIDNTLLDFVKIYGAKGLAWIKVTEEGFTGPIGKFFKETSHGEALMKVTQAEPGDVLMFVADEKDVVHDALGALRNKLAQDLDLIPEDQYEFVWIVDWPLFEYSEEEGRYTAAHHPFTMPKEEDVDKLESAPAEVGAQAYDIVLNGYEIGGGSLRIYEKDLQMRMFKALGFTEEEATDQFDFLLEAMDYGFPPHGGLAFGLDRLVMVLAGEDNIREVMAFPKNQSAVDPMTQAPGPVADEQLEELGLEIAEEELD